MNEQDQLIRTLELQALGCAALGCPFYEGLCQELVLEVKERGPAIRLLEPFAAAPFEAAYVLRFFGGLHRLVLRDAAPTLAEHFPSVGGDGDARATRIALRDLMEDPPADVVAALTRPPQTNEVGRAVALASGLLVIARDTGLPLRLRELGTSAGLNLRLDQYWYEHDGQGWGDPKSPVRFVDLWDHAPPFRPGVTILDRRGCDRHPIDVTTDDGARTVLSYVWPEPRARFVRAEAAIRLALDHPVDLDVADIDTWLPQQLRDPLPGSVLVVYHSVVWQYLDDAVRSGIREQLQQAGEASTPETPLAWLRLEPEARTGYPAELRLTLWSGQQEPADQLLATTGFHGGPIAWIATG